MSGGGDNGGPEEAAKQIRQWIAYTVKKAGAVTVWANIYDASNPDIVGRKARFFRTKRAADKAKLPMRLACVELSFDYGEGLSKKEMKALLESGDFVVSEEGGAS